MSKQLSQLFGPVYPTQDGEKPKSFVKPAFDNSDTKKVLWTAQQTEEKWFQEVNGYLFGKPELEDYREWYKYITANYVGQYRGYNNKYYSQFGGQPGAFIINDIALSIPPESIAVEVTNNTTDVPILRSKSSVKIDSGMGEVSVVISIPFADNPMFGITLEDELKYKLVPILTQLKTIPFCQVKNDYLKDKIVQGLNNFYDENKFSAANAPDLMLTYQNYRMSTTAESPRIVRMDLSFLLFNYKAYMHNVEYPTYFEMEGTHRKMVDGKSIPEGKVKTPSKSLPFYQFYAKEFEKREETLTYTHGKDASNLFELGYYDYIIVPTYLLTPESKKLLVNLEKETLDENRDTAGIVTEIIPDSEIKSLVDLIDRSEGRGDYNIMFGGKSNPAISKMTIKEIISYQKKLKYSAVGRYQFIRTTLQDFVSRGSVNPDSLFDENGQDYLFKLKLADRGLPKYLNGKISELEFANNLASEWAAFEYDHSGRGRYDSDGVNHATISTEDVIKAIRSLNTNGEQKNTPNPQQMTRVELQKAMDNLPKDLKTFINVPSYVQDDAKKIAIGIQGLTTEGKEITLSETERNIQNIINDISKIPGVEFIQMNSSVKNTYIRIPRRLVVPNSYGIETTMIESFGGHEIARIPLSGYRFATHQYMGGSVDKVAIQMIIYNDLGDMSFRAIQEVFNQVAENAIKFKNFAAFDGVLLKEKFINNIVGGKYYVLDSLRTEAHPQIPGASLVSFVLTDFTKTKEQAKRAIEWNNMNPDLAYDSYYKSILQELFSQIDIHAYTYTRQNMEETDRYAGKVRVVGMTAEAIANDPVDNKTYISLEIKNKNKFEEIIQQALSDLETELNGANFLLDQQYLDKFDITRFIDTTGSKDSAAIFKALSGNDDDKYYLTLKKWAQKWSKQLTTLKFRNGKDLLPQTTKIFTDSVKAALKTIISPAYIDFDLPASIDPDYYFYQPSKTLSVNHKKEKLTQGAVSRSVEVYKELTRQLTPEGHEKGYRIIEEMEKELLVNDREPQARLMMPANSQISAWDKLKKQYNSIDILPAEENGADKYPKLNIAQAKLDMQCSGAVANNAAIFVPTCVRDEEGKLVIEKIEATDEQKQKLFEEKSSIFYTDDIVYNNYAIQKRLNDMPVSNMDLMRAFPVFKIYIIEEDETELLAPFRQDFNDMFGLNAIQQIRLVEHSDQPADLMTVDFIDMTGRFVSAKYKEYANQEKPKSPDVIDTKDENPLKGIMLKDGTCIQMRMGYSNNINDLDTKFNGYIVSVDGDLNQYSLICQSYGVELIQSVKYPQGAKDITTFNAETKEILQWAITQPEVKHFGRWKYSDNSNFQLSDDNGGIALFNYKRVRPDGSIARSWAWTKEEGESNLISPEEPSDQGIKNWSDNVKDGFFGYLASFGWLNLRDSLWSRYYVSNTTLWQVIDEMTYRYPGYVAKVMPFEDRATLFYGHPDAPYFYRRLTLSEGEIVAEERRKLDKITKQLSDHSWKTILDSILASKYPYTKEERNILAKNLGKLVALQAGENAQKADFHSTGEQQRELTTKIFRSYHPVTSANHIIRNLTKADYRSVYTEVQVGYKKFGGSEANPSDLDELKTVRMNDFLEEEDIRTTYLPGINVESPFTAYQYGSQQLWRESKKLYKGELTMIGNPKIKPYDILLLFDEATQTYGPVEVNQHVLTLIPGQGMVSSITPNLMSSIRNLVGMSNEQAHNYIAAGGYGVEKMEAGGDDWFTRNFFTEQGTIQLGNAIQNYGSAAGAGYVALGMLGIASLGVISAAVGALGILALSQLNHQILMAGKYRNPIILHPLIRMGVPYLYGMNTYKNLGLSVWQREKWKILKEDVSYASKVIQYALEDLF